MTNDMASIREKLLSKLGVNPCTDWLRACQEHLQQRQRPVTLESVFFQVLYSDLRDVLGNTNNENNQLQQAILRSQKDNCVQDLPPSFLQLVQLEEAVNVAKSTEQRLQNASSNSKCCKVLLSDGRFHFQGLETMPIQGLDCWTLAGSKVLLRGTIAARHGILLLNPANFIRLGGCCRELVSHQTKALHDLRQGVGTDPTIRALVQKGMEEEEGEEKNDEGFVESGDVVASVPPPQISERLETTTRMLGTKRTESQISNSTNAPQPQIQHQQQQPSFTQPQQVSNSTHRPLQQQQQQQQSSVQSTLPRKSANPYQRTTQQPQKRQRSDTATHTAARITPQPPMRQHQNSTVNSTQSKEIATSNPDAPHFLYSTPKSMAQKMTFDNLHRLLVELSSNRDMYESYYQQKIQFRVELSVPDQSQHEFNVVKVGSKKTKRYEYFTSARFGNSHHAIACQIHPTLLEPCFDVSANELRRLSRTDRPKCSELTRDGGETVSKTYFAPREWHVSLLMGTEEAFGANPSAVLTNLKQPILLLHKV